MFYELEYAYNAKENDYVIDSYLICILNNIKRYIGKNSNQNLMINRIREYIHDHANEKLTVNQVANVFGYNKDYLVRIL